MSNIPVHELTREVRHAAWTPVNPDGTTPALAGSGSNAANDWQPFGTGSGGFVRGTSPNTVTFTGDDGQMMTISGYATQDTIEDHTGDGDEAVQMRSVELEVPQARQMSLIVPATWQWMAKFLQTVFRDAMKRPMEIRDTYATGVTVVQKFLVGSLSHPIAAKGVLRIEADLTPYDKATETGLV